MDNEIAIKWLLGFLIFSVGSVIWMVRYAFQGFLYDENSKMKSLPFIWLILLIALTFIIIIS